MARAKGITQFYMPPARLSTKGNSLPAFTTWAFTRWRHPRQR